ncbi:MAG: glycosyltransferase [Desulfobulbaceae bacterium]|nr:MAG: glycosyltransferase [Desulfobulbaceae bacterium]
MNRQDQSKRKKRMRFRARLLLLGGKKLPFVSRLIRNRQIRLMFDYDYYRNQLPEAQKNVDLVDHFCESGWRAKLNPHPLFDTTYYLNRYPDVMQAGINPLLHFLEHGGFENRNPHPLFDVSYYLASNPEAADSGLNPLFHYVSSETSAQSNPHPLFDADYYLSSNSDVARADSNPLIHFLKFGALERRNPHPLFDVSHYLASNPVLDQHGVNALSHYLVSSATEQGNPHPGFDNDYYRARYQLSQEENPLINYLQHPWRSPSPWFEPLSFTRPDELDIAKSNPLAYALYGIHLVQIPGGEKESTSWSEDRLPDEQRYGSKPLIYIATHEASLTGAPAIILNIARHIASSAHYDLVIFMHRGGHLLPEFKLLGEVVCFEEITRLSDGNGVLDRVISGYCRRNPRFAIVNSMESSFFLSAFGKADIPVLTLIHEFVTSYQKELVTEAINYSRKIVFPSQFVKEIATRNYELNEGDCTVIPQGLLNPDFGNLDRDKAREEIRKGLGLPPDSFIVLGCGVVALRKGPDLFVQIGAALQRDFGLESIYFVWLGKNGQEFGYSHYLEQDIERLGVQSHMLFVGEKENVEPFFVGSDLFLLTSREDPFPCVVHEAMAASLPVIVFADSGGAPEAVGDVGIVVPYGDIRAAAEQIHKLYLSSSLRQTYGTMARQHVHTYFNFTNYCSLLANYVLDEFAIDLKIATKVVPEIVDQPMVIPSEQQEATEDYSEYTIRTQQSSRKRLQSRPLFIVGTTRSGTSIMKLALRRIYGDFSPHEGHLWPLYKELHERIAHYYHEHEDISDFPNTLFHVGRETFTDAICNVFDAFHRQHSVKGEFVDKTPDSPIITTLPLIQSMYPGLRVIFMKRHGVNNLESKLRRFPDKTFAHHCRFWNETMEAWLQVREQIIHTIEIDQGLLLVDPVACSETIAAFLELTYNQKEALCSLFQEREIEKTSSDVSINKKMIDTCWSSEEQEIFTRICGQTMTAFGYDF